MKVSRKSIGYTLFAAGNSLSPSDATTYYWGSIYVQSPTGTDGRARMYIPKSGTVRTIRLFFDQVAGLGTSETSSAWFRLNSTTDTLISSSIVNDVGATTAVNSTLAIPVVAGDFFEIKWTTPTWVTNPTGVRCTAIVYID